MTVTFKRRRRRRSVDRQAVAEAELLRLWILSLPPGNTFRMKPVEALPKPIMGRQRLVGLVVLRSYLLIAFTLTVVKIAEVAVK
jgi:hypothetical protein